MQQSSLNVISFPGNRHPFKNTTRTINYITKLKNWGQSWPLTGQEQRISTVVLFCPSLVHVGFRVTKGSLLFLIYFGRRKKSLWNLSPHKYRLDQHNFPVSPATWYYLHWEDPCREGVMDRFNQSVHRPDLHPTLQLLLQRNMQSPP